MAFWLIKNNIWRESIVRTDVENVRWVPGFPLFADTAEDAELACGLERHGAYGAAWKMNSGGVPRMSFVRKNREQL